jgi:hypothetical protein
MNGRNVPASVAAFTAFVGCVVAANWALGRWGIVPIGFGLMAPAGVYFAGLTFGVRDIVHELGGRRLVLAAIGVACGVSYALEDAVTIPGGHAPIAVASALAFALSELADFAVYSPLRERNWTVASIASNVVGAVIDSAIFLWLAFGSFDHITGNVVGKFYLVAAALPIIYLIRRRAVSGNTVQPAGA